MDATNPQNDGGDRTNRAYEAYENAKENAVLFWGWLASHANTDRIIAASTVVIMVATIGGAVSTYLQWTELQSSSEQIERSIKASNRIADEAKTANGLTGQANRPWIGAVGVTVTPPIFELKPSTIHLNISNAGKSPAYIVQVRCAAAVLETSPTDPFYNISVAQTEVGSKSIMVPGQQFGCPLYQQTLPAQDLGRIKLSAGQYSFYIYGEIVYRDIATEANHSTRVCWYYSAKVDAYVYCPTYNSAN